MSPSGAQLERARWRDKLDAVAELVAHSVPDPGGRLTRAAATHDAAHQQLDRAAALDRIELTARRAKNRLRKLRGLMRMLDKTDHVCSNDGPCREARHRVIDPVLAALAKAAQGTRSPRRERLKEHGDRRSSTGPSHPTKETPMADPNYRPGQVIEESAAETAQREQADAARRAAAEVRGVPETLVPYLRDFDSCWRVPQTEPVREHRARELAKAILNQPERDRAPLVAWLIHRLARRGVR